MDKAYLGDSVYAEFDGFSIVLTTDNGFGPSNTICLDPDVLLAVIRYAGDIHAKYFIKVECDEV